MTQLKKQFGLLEVFSIAAGATRLWQDERRETFFELILYVLFSGCHNEDISTESLI